MIPEFPEFKILELSDKEDVEKFTLKYPPYSDFNFAGTWSWDVREQMKISQLNGNYVIRFVSYLTGEPFYTFLGENKVNETAKTLLDLSIKENLKPELKLISEETAKGLDAKIFKIEEDRDNFDYIYDLEKLKNYEGSSYKSQRNSVNHLLNNYPDAEVKILNLGDKKIQEEIIGLYQKWVKYKTEENTKKDLDFDQQHELIVIKKLFSANNKFNLSSVGIFLENELIAFCVDELKNSEYAVAHISKTNPLLVGINAFLMQKSAEILHSNEKKYLDYEQDLGKENLREAKRRFRPSFFLKKYQVSYV